jgi:N-acylneuraminate cytidylyltransferase
MKDNSKSLCIIPARGGSKRIPRKNIKNFLGKPIIAYSIEAAIKSKLFDEVMVSTDDEEIAEVAKKYGAKVPFMRTKENADDFATISDVVDEVISFYESKKLLYHFVCCVLPTTPLNRQEYLIEGLNLLKDTSAQFVRPIVKFSYPIQRALRQIEGGIVEMVQPEFKRTRSQDLEPTYHDAGQFYWFYFKTRMQGEPKYGFEVSQIYVQDIDTIEDWELAELKYKYIYNN